MSLVSSCNSGNVFYHDSDALKLMDQLCACPSVRSVLASLGDRVPIHVLTGAYPGIRIAHITPKSGSDGEEEIELQIPQRSLKVKDTLPNLVLEIFNMKQHEEIAELTDRAQRGKVDIEDYAKSLETIEFKSKEKAIDLSLECKFFKESDTKDIVRDLEIHLWNKEFDCHTDQIRTRWINDFQNAYCQKNPKKKSCKLQSQDFCDRYAVVRMSEDDRYQVRVNRLCERLSKLPQKVKDWYPSEVRYCLLKNEL